MNIFQRITRRSLITVAAVAAVVLAVSAVALRGRQNAADAAANAQSAGPVAEFLQDDLYIAQARATGPHCCPSPARSPRSTRQR